MAQRADEILATHCNSLPSCSHILCAAPHPNGRDTPLNTTCMLQDHMHGRTVRHSLQGPDGSPDTSESLSH